MPTITEIGHQQFKMFINNNKFQQRCEEGTREHG